jgi:HK97 gp10 family phage protein
MSIAELSRLPEEIKNDIAKVIAQAATGIPNALKPLTPIRTGHLRRSWKGTHTKFQGRVSNTAAYAAFVEFGTSRSRAQPMLSPLIPLIEVEIERAIMTGTDFYLKGAAFTDRATQLKQGYKSKYGNYGSHRGYSG